MGTPSLPTPRERLIQLLEIFKNDTICKEFDTTFNKNNIIYDLEDKLQIPHQECNFNVLFLKLFNFILFCS